MNVKSILDSGRDLIMKTGGLDTTINIISYTFTNSDYDDVVTQTATGSNVVSGLVFPIKALPGSNEALLMEQGKLLTKDKIVYTGSVNVSGNVLVELKSGDFYTIVGDGIQSWEINGSTIYQKFFISHTIAGSLF